MIVQIGNFSARLPPREPMFVNLATFLVRRPFAGFPPLGQFAGFQHLQRRRNGLSRQAGQMGDLADAGGALFSLVTAPEKQRRKYKTLVDRQWAFSARRNEPVDLLIRELFFDRIQFGLFSHIVSPLLTSPAGRIRRSNGGAAATAGRLSQTRFPARRSGLPRRRSTSPSLRR